MGTPLTADVLLDLQGMSLVCYHNHRGSGDTRHRNGLFRNRRRQPQNNSTCICIPNNLYRESCISVRKILSLRVPTVSNMTTSTSICKIYNICHRLLRKSIFPHLTTTTYITCNNKKSNNIVSQGYNMKHECCSQIQRYFRQVTS